MQRAYLSSRTSGASRTFSRSCRDPCTAEASPPRTKENEKLLSGRRRKRLGRGLQDDSQPHLGQVEAFRAPRRPALGLISRDTIGDAQRHDEEDCNADA